MKAMKTEAVDLRTGEVLEVLLIGRSLKLKDKGFVKVMASFLEDLVRDEEVAGKAIRLLLYMLEKLDWNSLELWIDPKEAMQELGISETTFYRWLKVLLEKGYIQKLNAYRYKLKPYAVVRGSFAKVEEVDF